MSKNLGWGGGGNYIFDACVIIRQNNAVLYD